MVSRITVAGRLRAVLGDRANVRSRKSDGIVILYSWHDDAFVNAKLLEWASKQRGPQPRIVCRRVPESYPATYRRYEVVKR